MGLYVPATPIVGTWTPNPVLGGSIVSGDISGGATTGWTFVVGGNYCKIGRFVLIEGDVTVSVKGSATGSFWVRGLPFRAMNDSGSGWFFPATMSGTAGATKDTHWQCGVPSNCLIIQCAHLISGAETALADTDLAVSSYFKFSGSYLTD